MAASKKKRLYRGPWKLRRSDNLNKIELRPRGRDGDVELYLEGYKEYERIVGRGVPWTECRKEEHPTVTLSHMLEALKMSDKQLALLELMKSGVAVVLKLHERYCWYQRREEEKAEKNKDKIAERNRKRRERQRLEDQRDRARQAKERKAKKAKELAEKQRQRKAAKAQRLEQQAKMRAQREKEAVIKKATADHKKRIAAQEKQEAAIVQFRSSFWKKPHSRNLEI